MSWQEERLLAMAAGISVDEEPLDLSPDELPPNPVQGFIDDLEFAKAGGKGITVPAISPPDEAIAKALVSNRLGIGQFGSAALQKTARTETVNGWVYSYDGSNALVSARQVDDDGGALSKREPVHQDGVEEERVGNQLWKHHYQGGQFVGSELHDPELDDVMYFDADGNEKAA